MTSKRQHSGMSGSAPAKITTGEKSPLASAARRPLLQDDDGTAHNPAVVDREDLTGAGATSAVGHRPRDAKRMGKEEARHKPGQQLRAVVEGSSEDEDSDEEEKGEQEGTYDDVRQGGPMSRNAGLDAIRALEAVSWKAFRKDPRPYLDELRRHGGTAAAPVHRHDALLCKTFFE